MCQNSIYDPIQTELVGHTFKSITEEMSITIQRTAYSSIVREALDYSTAVFDEKGNLIAQADNIPAHLGVMSLTLKLIIKEHIPVGSIEEGDQIIINHPYLGASHTPDILLFAPVFVENQLIGFCGSMCHHVDVGGSTPGSSPGDATDLFQEGLLIPPLKLIEKGSPNKTLFAIIKSNIRMPDYTLGDLRAQISANQIGEKRMKSLYEKYGIHNTKGILDELFNYAEKRIRSKIRNIPDGIYEAEGHLDDDGVNIGKQILIKVKIEIKNDDIIFDLTHSNPQVKGPFNVTEQTVWAAALYVTKCVTDPFALQNEGAFRPITVKLKNGTIFKPNYPAPVSARHHTNMRLAEVCLEALFEAMQNEIPASSNAHITSVAISGNLKQKKDKQFVYYEINGGGAGARYNKDGLSGIDVHLGNCMNVPIEAAELEYPIRFEEYELIPDSGGAGKFRGGLGFSRSIRMLSDGLTVSIRSDAETTLPKGMLGGGNGKAGRKYLISSKDNKIKKLYGKTTRLPLNKNDILKIETPGSGGYGKANEREAVRVINDWKDEYITEEAMNTYYKGALKDLSGKDYLG